MTWFCNFWKKTWIELYNDSSYNSSDTRDDRAGGEVRNNCQGKLMKYLTETAPRWGFWKVRLVIITDVSERSNLWKKKTEHRTIRSHLFQYNCTYSSCYLFVLISSHLNPISLHSLKFISWNSDVYITLLYRPAALQAANFIVICTVTTQLVRCAFQTVSEDKGLIISDRLLGHYAYIFRTNIGHKL